MNNTELAELLLQRLYERATAEGYGKDHLLADLPEESADVFQVQTVAEMLAARGLVAINRGYFHPKRGAFGRITGEGCLLVEQAIEAAPGDQPPSIPGNLTIQIDQSTNFNSPVNSANIAVGSTAVKQHLGLSPTIAQLLEEIGVTIRQDKTISAHERARAWDHVELLKNELKTDEPRPGVISNVLGRLGDISSIASLVTQLAGALPGFR